MSQPRHRPRKRFGQHFLHDANVIERIITAIQPRAGDRLVEIGPGTGALSLPLLQRHGRLQVVEFDRDLVARLRELEAPGLEVIEADALRFDFTSLAGAGERLRLLGNLPYNISTPLLFHLLGQGNCIRDMVFMLQEEVAERLCAQAGTPAYGRLSVMAQYHCQTRFLFRVSRGAFSPPPKVESAIIQLQPCERDLPAADPDGLARLVSAAFGKRRKTLRNALKGWLEDDDFKTLDIDPGRRPETLTVTEFVRLSNHQQLRPTTMGD